ncbi:AAA family ATPase [Paenibacillus illinoisensis]|uniref:AAA family ATPase n=1 Tax=Paenibacillus illinoisensis TaxID=59845 RepID=UPI003D287024
MSIFFTQTFSQNRSTNTAFTSKGGEFFVLTKDNWNDYGFETTFFLDYWKNNTSQFIGLVRILHISETATRFVIEDSFDELTNDFISLGYNEQYYNNIIALLGRTEAKRILTKLRDISITGLEKNEKFNLEHEGIQNSFFRSSEGRYLYSEVNDRYFLDKETQDRDYSFEFKALLSAENDFTKIDFDFTRSNELPNRLFTIVGKNGVGKTRLLNQLAESLFDSSKPENRNRFTLSATSHKDLDSDIPIFNKIIAISFSVFDKFYKGSLDDHNNPQANKESDENLTKFNNYTYVGLHKVDNTIYTADELIEINKRSYRNIIENNLEDLFIDSINSSNILNNEIIKAEFDYNVFFSEIYSSGQSIFVTMLCRLLSEIKEGSLVFLDEPELYLHPNAMANLARIYYKILSQFKSYAILCTHSPIITQEIPSRYVRKISIIDGDTINYTKPNIETFGSNISDITTEIFNVLDNESMYKSLLKEWARTKSEDEVLSLFDDRLSFKTQLFISSLYKESDGK